LNDTTYAVKKYKFSRLQSANINGSRRFIIETVSLIVVNDLPFFWLTRDYNVVISALNKKEKFTGGIW